MDEEVLARFVEGDEAVAFILVNHLTVPWAISGTRLSFPGPRTNKKPPRNIPGGASIKNKTHLLLPSEGTTDQGRGFKEEESRPSSMI